MQSSAAVVLRALLMLACLVGIPLIALFGSSLPQFVTKILEGHLPACLSSASATPSEPSEFEPTAPAALMPAALASPTPPDRAMQPLWESSSPMGPPREPVGAAVAPAVYEAPMGAGPSGVQQLAGRAPVSNPAVSASVISLPASNAPAAQNDPAAMRPGQQRGEVRNAGQGAAPVDQFSFIQDRLRKLGATYYLLESWGNQQDLFRFYCKMAIGGNPNYTRHFEATHGEPLRAMAMVLQQVEAWRASRE